MKQDTRFIQNTQVIFHKEGSCAYLYDPDSGSLKHINTVGTSLYELCDGHHPLEEMIARITDEYQDVPRDEIEKDVDRFLMDLLGMDFVRHAPEVR
jgi:hypothetical protein